MFDEWAADQDPVFKRVFYTVLLPELKAKGKTVIVIKDFASHLPQSVIETIAKKVRTACGCGGTVKERRVEIQGDQADRIRAVLEGEGFEVAGVK